MRLPPYASLIIEQRLIVWMKRAICSPFMSHRSTDFCLLEVLDVVSIFKRAGFEPFLNGSIRGAPDWYKQNEFCSPVAQQTPIQGKDHRSSN
jgi:hypothetical protein